VAIHVGRLVVLGAVESVLKLTAPPFAVSFKVVVCKSPLLELSRVVAFSNNPSSVSEKLMLSVLVLLLLLLLLMLELLELLDVVEVLEMLKVLEVVAVAVGALEVLEVLDVMDLLIAGVTVVQVLVLS